MALVSSLGFQILLYFNFFFAWLFFAIFLATSVVKLWIYAFSANYLPLIAICVWLPLEMLRIYYGYRGNINATFPELIAFTIFTLFAAGCIFLLAVPPPIRFPCELCVLAVQVLFMLCEFFVGLYLICKYMAHSSTIFFLRGQTMLDRDLQLYHSLQTIKTSREIELGLKKATQQTRRAQGLFKQKIDELLSHLSSHEATPYSRLTSARFTRAD